MLRMGVVSFAHFTPSGLFQSKLLTDEGIVPSEICLLITSVNVAHFLSFFFSFEKILRKKC